MAIKLIPGDALTELRKLPAESVHCCVTSPPYFGLRAYLPEGHPDKPREIGLEATPELFVATLVEVFREVRRVLRKDGTCWINLGDSYATGTSAPSSASKTADVGGWTTRSGDAAGARRVVGQGYKPKDLMGIPWRVAFALQDDGWYLRQDIIWAKPNPMPESVTDRCTKAHEYLFLLSKSPKYHYDAEAIAEAAEVIGGRICGPKNDASRNDGDTVGTVRGDGLSRNRRSVWTVATQPYSEAHFATFPPDLIEPCIKAGCPKDCCAKCGAPVVRMIEVESRPNEPSSGERKNDGTYYRDTPTGNFRGEQRRSRSDNGWSPSCSCDAGLARGTVLDPFGGAGTTGLVADRLQRDAILIELSPTYAALAQKRIVDDGPLFASVAVTSDEQA